MSEGPLDTHVATTGGGEIIECCAWRARTSHGSNPASQAVVIQQVRPVHALHSHRHVDASWDCSSFSKKIEQDSSNSRLSCSQPSLQRGDLCSSEGLSRIEVGRGTWK